MVPKVFIEASSNAGCAQAPSDDETTAASQTGLLRDKRAAKSAVASIVVQFLSRAMRLVVIPLSLQILGPEQYGLWLVVGSVVAWGGLADVGIAPGLINTVASAQGRGDRNEMQAAISTALLFYSAVAIALAAAAVLFSRWEPLPAILGVEESPVAGAAPWLVCLVGVLFAASTLTRVVTTTSGALQEGYLNSYADVAGSLISLALLIALWLGGTAELLDYALVCGVPPVVMQIILGIYLFGYRHPDLRPTLTACSGTAFRVLWNYAGPLGAYQLANLLVNYTATLIIANRLGATAVVQYSVPYSLFAVIMTLVWYAASPYVPAIVEAEAKGDRRWIRNRIQALLKLSSGAVGVGGGLVLLFGRPLIGWWTADVVIPTTSLLGALFFFAFFRTLANAANQVLVGLGQVKVASWAYVASAVLFVSLGWVFTPLYGIVAVAAAGGLTHFLYSTVGLRAIATWSRAAV